MSPKTVSPSGETAAMSGQQQKLVIRDRSHLELKKVQPKVLFFYFYTYLPGTKDNFVTYPGQK